jgi:hypothetical protein
MKRGPILHLGEWQSAEWSRDSYDLLVADPPYGARTHEGYRSGSDASDDSGIDDYAFWTPDHVFEFVRHWSPRVDGWMVCMTSHDLIPSWERALQEEGRLGFVPIPLLETAHTAPCAVVPAVVTGSGVRLQGDGPSNWTLQLIVARPRKLRFSRWCKEHRRPEPFYLGPAVRGSKKGRGKPDWLMRAIVRDYSRPGASVVDPTMGWGATGCAAIGMGRSFEGAEVDHLAFAEACDRIGRVQAVDLFDPSGAQQDAMFGEAG